jgi:hypothetical protein
VGWRITYIETGGEKRVREDGESVGEYFCISGGMSQYKNKGPHPRNLLSPPPMCSLSFRRSLVLRHASTIYVPS